MTTKGENRVRAALLGVSLLALVYGFRELIFVHAPFVFSDPLEDMSFGWYVPIFSAYVVWRERRELMASLGEPSLAGLAAALAALFVGFLGVRGVQIRLEIVAFAALLVAVPWAMYGRRTAARLAFPAAFLLFCIPLATFLDVVTVHLRLLASAVAAAILEGVGAAVERVGTTITTSGGFAIDVAAPCAGLRSIFALLALAAGYGYFALDGWWRRAALFALAVPIAVVGNIARVLMICLVGTWCSPSFATGFYHDYSGYVVFLVAIAMMVGCAELLRGRRRK